MKLDHRQTSRVACLAALLALFLCSAGAQAAERVQVLLVGDQVARLTAPHLQRYLPEAEFTVATVPGATSPQALKLAEKNYEPGQSVVIFDAGSNDDPGKPEDIHGSLLVLADSIGDSCMVVPTTYGRTGGVDDEYKHKAIFEFADTRPGTQIPEWFGVTQVRPELMRPDGLLPNRAGVEYRARLLAQGVEDCLARNAGDAGIFGGRPRVSEVATLSRGGAVIGEIFGDAALAVVRQAALAALVQMVLPLA